MNTLMRPGTAILLLVFSACDILGTEPEPRDFAGRWIVTESGRSVELGLSCASTGVLQVSQSSRALSGEYDKRGLCTLEPNATEERRSGPISAGRVTAYELRFEHHGCIYRGELRNRDGSVTGTIRCTLEVAGKKHAYAGSWSAQRVPEPAP